MIMKKSGEDGKSAYFLYGKKIYGYAGRLFCLEHTCALCERCCLQAQVVMLPSGKRPGDVKAYCLFLRSQTRKGGCIMVLNGVLQLFVIVGGTVGITFQIAWAIFKEIHNNKK